MISVVILSYNTRDLTLKCLDFLHKSKDTEFEIIVIDNASSDGSIQAISQKFPQVKLIPNQDNVGFAKGNNQGMIKTKGNIILLLNSDCFVEPDTLAICQKSLAKYDVVGCKLLNSDRSIQPSFGFFPTLSRLFLQMTFIDNLPIVRKYIKAVHVRDLTRYTREQEADWVTGAFTMLKREVFKKTGGIDEKYFMYGEEMEWMYRVKKDGFKIGFIPQATAVHLQGASTKSKTKMFLSEMKGLIYWYSKHNPKWQQIILSWILIFGCLIRIPAWAVWGKWDLAKAYMEILPKLIRQ